MRRGNSTHVSLIPTYRKRIGRENLASPKSQAAAIAGIESGEETYYVNIGVSTPNLMVAVHKGVKYLKAPVDNDTPATLLNLPDCQRA